MYEGWNQFLQGAEAVQVAEQFAEPGWLRQERHESLRRLLGDDVGQLRRGAAHGFPSAVGNALVVQVGHIGQAQDLSQIPFDFLEAASRGANARWASAEIP